MNCQERALMQRRQRARRDRSHHQGPHQTGSHRGCHSIKLINSSSGLLQHLFHQMGKGLHMAP